MANARRNRNRTEAIVSSWIRGGGNAYLGLAEIVGDCEQSLSSVLEATQRAITATFYGKAWAAAKSKYGLVGRITTLLVSRSSSGAWIVRRWLVLAGERALVADEVEQLGAWLGRRLTHSLDLGQDQLGAPFTLRAIDPAEVTALARHICDCTSALDAGIAPYSESLNLEFSRSGEQLPVDLASKYRDHSASLVSEFAWAAGHRAQPRDPERFEPGERVKADPIIVRRADEYMFSIESGESTRNRYIDVPEGCRDFLEYALSMAGVAIWTCYMGRGSNAAGQRWSYLVDEVRQKMRNPAYLDYESNKAHRYRRK